MVLQCECDKKFLTRDYTIANSKIWPVTVEGLELHFTTITTSKPRPRAWRICLDVCNILSKHDVILQAVDVSLLFLGSWNKNQRLKLFHMLCALKINQRIYRRVSPTICSSCTPIYPWVLFCHQDRSPFERISRRRLVLPCLLFRLKVDEGEAGQKPVWAS